MAASLLRDRALDLLPLTILRVEALRQRHGFVETLGHQEMQRLLRSFQPARSIEPRRELETDVKSAKRFWRLRDLFQRHQARARGCIQALQSSGNQDAIFTRERNEISNRPQC